MICPKCGYEFSEPILELHMSRCKEEKEKENKEPKKEVKASKK